MTRKQDKKYDVGTIYVIKNIDTGTCYIGQTQFPVEMRWRGHLNFAKNGGNTHFCKAIRKHGPGGFATEVLERCEISRLNDRESYWISQLLSADVSLYNMTAGGDGTRGYSHSDAARKKMSIARKGKHTSEETKLKLSAVLKGKKRSQKTREMMSKAQKGKPKPRGRAMSAEHRQKISSSHVGKKHSEQTRAKLVESQRRRRENESHFLAHPEQYETYVSVDIETTGPIPGPFSMISVGCVAFDAMRREVGEFCVNIEQLPFAGMHPETQKFWDKNQEAWLSATTDPVDPCTAMKRLADWVKSLPGKPVFVAYPAGFDFSFVVWYLHMFANENPFSFSSLDIKSFACASLRKPFRETVKKNFPSRWQVSNARPHFALDDARQQGEMFMKMLRDQKRWVQHSLLSDKMNKRKEA